MVRKILISYAYKKREGKQEFLVFLFRNVSKEEKYLSAQIVSCLNTGDYEVFVSVLRSIVSKMCCIAYFVCMRM